MAVDLRLPLLATNDAHYLEACDHEHHDALLCIGTATNLDDPNRFRFDGQGFYVKDGDEMAEVFRDHPSARRELARDRRALRPRARDRHRALPDARVPGAGGHDARGGARRAGVGGAARAARARARRADSAASTASTRERMEHELGVITVDGLRGLLPDRRRLHRLRAQQRHPGRAGPRLGGGQPRRRGRSASPASIRSSTTSSSSDS